MSAALALAIVVAHQAAPLEAWRDTVRREIITDAAPSPIAAQPRIGPTDRRRASLEWEALADDRQWLGVALRPLAKPSRAPRLGVHYNLSFD